MECHGYVSDVIQGFFIYFYYEMHPTLQGVRRKNMGGYNDTFYSKSIELYHGAGSSDHRLNADSGICGR